MHVFRIFAVSLIIPFITVGLCSSGSESGNRRKSPQEKYLRRLESSPQDVPPSNSNATTTTVHFPSGKPGDNSSVVLEPRTSASSDSLPIHLHPLKLEVKIQPALIKNSTKADSFLTIDPLFEGEGRSSVTDWDAIKWMLSFLMKAMTSYFIVGVLNLILAPFLKRFGWDAPSWDTQISLGNNGKHSLFNLFGSTDVNKFKLSLGGKGKGKEDSKDGWGSGGGGGHHSGHPVTGAGGWSGLSPAGWMSYDQYALALPYVDKYSQKAAKKSAKFAKKAHKYAQKAHKYAAKAQAYQLQIRPAAYGQLPGIGGHHSPGLGWAG